MHTQQGVGEKTRVKLANGVFFRGKLGPFATEHRSTPIFSSPDLNDTRYEKLLLRIPYLLWITRRKRREEAKKQIRNHPPLFKEGDRERRILIKKGTLQN